jgi:hypothetical protein
METVAASTAPARGRQFRRIVKAEFRNRSIFAGRPGDFDDAWMD